MRIHWLAVNWQLENLTIGGGMNWQHGVDITGDESEGKERIEQSRHAVSRLLAHDQFNHNLSAQLKVNNLFDHKYYNQLSSFSQDLSAAERNVTLAIGYKY